MQEDVKQPSQCAKKMTDEISEELSKLSPEEMEKTLNRIREMAAAAKNYRSFSGTDDYDSVRFIFKSES